VFGPLPGENAGKVEWFVRRVGYEAVEGVVKAFIDYFKEYFERA
jgi:hypothetical protein